MKRFLPIFVFGIFIFAGCSTMGEKLTNEHAQTHNVEVNVNEKNKNILKYANVNHRLYEDQVYLNLSGTVKRPWGSFASRVMVDAKFINKEGQIIAEEKEKFLSRRTGGRTNRRQEASFLIQMIDNPDIVACTVEFEWV